MAASNAAKPRPNKNSDGQDKRPVPTMSHDINISPAPPAAPPTPPGSPAPGATNPMTHPLHPTMLASSMGQPPGGGPMPGTAPPGPTAAPQDNRQVQERIQFKDLNPVEQSQTAQQQGLDPYAPLKMVQQATQGAIQQGPSTSAIPNMLAGPYVPPGVESFPDDFAHLSQLMSQGMAPGASNQEHEFALNAHALAKAKISHAMSQAQNGVGQEQAAPYGSPEAPPTGPPPNVTLAAGIPGQGGPPQAPPGPPQGIGMGSQPPMQSSMGTPPGGAPGGAPPMPQPGPAGPPQMPGAPGAIPPAMIAALLAKHKPAGRIG